MKNNVFLYLRRYDTIKGKNTFQQYTVTSILSLSKE